MRKLSGAESVYLQRRLDVPESSLQSVLEYRWGRAETIGLPRGVLKPVTPKIRKIAESNTDQSGRNAR